MQPSVVCTGRRTVTMKIRKLWIDLRSSLWFRPIVWVLFLGILAFALMAADRRLGPEWEPFMSSSFAWFLVSGADGARAMLSAIATAVLTVTTLAFSIMMVAVVQTANAYSPRILPQYLSDASNQHVLGILLGTFIYSLLVLRAIHATGTLQEGVAFVPALATNGGLVLALISTGAFIYFINHAAHSISVSNIILLTLRETEAFIDRNNIFPGQVGEELSTDEEQFQPAGEGVALEAADGGYIQFFDTSTLMNHATKNDLTIRLDCAVGEYVVPGTTWATVWPAEAVTPDLRQALGNGIELSKQRSLVQDFLFGVTQLSDVAVRALSPGINDPSTAVHCIDGLLLLARKFMGHSTPSPYRGDENGNLRLIAYGPDFDTFLNTAFSQIRRYGSGDLQTTLRMLEVYQKLGEIESRPEPLRTLWIHATKLMETADLNMEVASDRRKINEWFCHTAEALVQDPGPYLLPALRPAEAEPI